ncbi:MAG TPA: tetratricopeptide repeat protein [Gammaproteobacteria bacterium]|nr:tetratricopeptide repeat protein [Gammaproteobacteria bacterium]
MKKNNADKTGEEALADNRLGTFYYHQKKWSEAIAAFRNAIQKEPEFINAHYNLGLALGKANQWHEAVLTYQHLLKLAPDHFAARFHLACVFMQTEKIDDALTEFLIIEQSEPHHFETQSNIAACYLKKNVLNEAKTHYQKALQLMRDDTQVLFNLGVIETRLGNTDSAIQYYQKAVQIDPDFFDAHNNLGVLFIAKEHVAFALRHFQEALRLQPHHPSIAYTVKALSQNERLLSAPAGYIQSLFNAYADHYDEHLLTALDYQIPSHFQRILKKNLSETGSLNILDIGCGTGLSGVIAKPFATSLTGVDLSEKMLEMAHAKSIYDTLHCADLMTFLSEKKAEYDLVIAGDVVVYIGKLDLLFQKTREALRKNGLFLFNAEISVRDDYQMNQSGRFSHQKNYLDTLSKQNHFTVLHYEKAITRLQNSEPVYGHLYLLRQTGS